MARSQLNSSQLALEHPARLGAQDPQPATLRMAQPSTLRHQSTTTMLGGLLSQGIKFAVVIYIARVFAPAQVGWLSFGIAVNAFLFIVGHFGLPVFGARSVAGTGVVCGDLLLSIFVSRMLLALTATALALGILWTIPNVGRQELLLVALFGLSNVPVAA